VREKHQLIMMREEFGDGHEAYMKRTKRLVPGVW
jgi:protein-S-isoprenylcysteine O-methyltransferase Ste14